MSSIHDIYYEVFLKYSVFLVFFHGDAAKGIVISQALLNL